VAEKGAWVGTIQALVVHVISAQALKHALPHSLYAHERHVSNSQAQSFDIQITYPIMQPSLAR